MIFFKVTPEYYRYNHFLLGNNSATHILREINSFSGKIQALVSATKEQRREYKSKFVDLDVEFARMRERLETMNMILDDIQVTKTFLYFLVIFDICTFFK